jgi:hypothetical protein
MAPGLLARVKTEALQPARELADQGAVLERLQPFCVLARTGDVEWFAHPEVTGFLALDLFFTLKQEEEWLDHSTESPTITRWAGEELAAARPA